MSISVMTHVWKHSRHKGSELLTLLAIADFAHDDGTHAYPSIKSLAKKTRMTERNVQIVLKKLEESKELSIKRNGGPHGCHSFRINLAGVKSFQGEKNSGVKSFRGEDISPTDKAIEKQIVIKDEGEKFSGGENYSRVKNLSEISEEISPNPSLEKTQEENPKTNPPPKPPPQDPGQGQGGRQGTGKVLEAQAQHVLAHLNTTLGRKYQVNKHIKARLNQGYTITDCKLVIDWLHMDRRSREPEWVEQYLDHTTPFREDNFDKYLQRAREWETQDRGQGRPGLADNVPYM